MNTATEEKVERVTPLLTRTNTSPSLNPTTQITTTKVTLKNKSKHKINLKSDALTYANFI